MSRSTLARLAKLERSGSGQQRRLLVASDQDEAQKLQVMHPTALIVVTGVPRAHKSRV